MENDGQLSLGIEEKRTLGEGHSKSDGVATTISDYNPSLDLDQRPLAYTHSLEKKLFHLDL